MLIHYFSFPRNFLIFKTTQHLCLLTTMSLKHTANYLTIKTVYENTQTSNNDKLVIQHCTI